MRVRFATSCLVALGFVSGCEGSGSESAEGTGSSGSTGGMEGSTAPTYYRDIAPLVNKECVSCHQDGGVAPFSLTDPTLAAGLGEALAVAVEARTMPPMPVNNDGSCYTYKNARWLSDEQIELFRSWVDAGAPLGDPADAPSPPSDERPRLSGELAKFDIGLDYTPRPAPGESDEYRCFVVDPEIAEDSFITGYDIVPGDSRVVHHVSLFYLLDADADAQAAALDAADPEPGYRCFGAAGVQKSIMYGVWVPGSGATILPEGTGIFHGAGRKLVVQMHYNVPAGGVFSDRSGVTYQLAHDPSLAQAFLLPAGSFEFSLPPGEAKASVSAEMTLELLGLYAGVTIPGGVRVWGSMPHMHVAGQTQRTVVKQEGAEQCLSEVDRWDFHWQDLWWYDEPIDVSADSTIGISCGFDTQGRAQPTTWGEGTKDEMCTNILYTTLLD